MLHFWHSKICPNLKATALLSYAVTDAECDYGRLFKHFYNVSQYFYDVYTYPIIVYLIMGLFSHSFGVCIKILVAVSGEEVYQMRNQWWLIVHVMYVNIIIATLLTIIIL